MLNDIMTLLWLNRQKIQMTHCDSQLIKCVSHIFVSFEYNLDILISM